MVLPLIMAAVGAGVAGYGLFESLQGKSATKKGLQEQQLGYQRMQQGANLQYELEKNKAQTSREFAQAEYDLNRNVSQASKGYALESAALNKEVVNTQFLMEAQRMQAMELDAKRQQMEIIRNQQRARSLAAATATSQGAQFGSALPGSYGQIQGQSGNNMLGVQQQLDLGRNMFNLNRQLAGQKQRSVDLESAYAAYRADQQTNQAGIAYNYALINADYQTQAAGIQTNYMSQGQGQVYAGQGQAQMGQSQTAFGQSLINMGINIGSMGSTAGNIFNNFMPSSAGGGFAGLGLGFGNTAMSTGRLY